MLRSRNDLRANQQYVSCSVRNHGGIPDIDEDAFTLEIGENCRNLLSTHMSYEGREGGWSISL